MLDEKSICYSAGAGEDITFDEALIEKVGCDVYIIDPTPRAIKFVQNIGNPSIHLLPLGLWSTNSEQRFYAPQNPKHVSHSITNLQQTGGYFTAKCRRLKKIMGNLGHDKIDLLKMDIEGAETEVINDILSGSIRPTILCVEYHKDAKQQAQLLVESGYSIIAKRGNDYTFLYDESK